VEIVELENTIAEDEVEDGRMAELVRLASAVEELEEEKIEVELESCVMKVCRDDEVDVAPVLERSVVELVDVLVDPPAEE
jgi:hypothetical protein